MRGQPGGVLPLVRQPVGVVGAAGSLVVSLGRAYGAPLLQWRQGTIPWRAPALALVLWAARSSWRMPGTRRCVHDRESTRVTCSWPRLPAGSAGAWFPGRLAGHR